MHEKVRKGEGEPGDEATVRPRTGISHRSNKSIPRKITSEKGVSKFAKMAHIQILQSRYCIWAGPRASCGTMAMNVCGVHGSEHAYIATK